LFNLNAESAQGVDGVHAIVAREKTAQGARAIGKRGDDGGAMRDTFITRDGDFSLNPRRSFYAQLHN